MYLDTSGRDGQSSPAAAQYRFYLIDSLRHFAGRQDFQASDDAEAIAVAFALLEESKFPMAELWQLGRFVQVLTRLGGG